MNHMSDIAADFALAAPAFSVVLAKRVPADRAGPIANSLTSGVATIKQTLLAGGLLRSVQWCKPGKRDVRGRRTFSFSMLDALIEQRGDYRRTHVSMGRSASHL